MALYLSQETRNNQNQNGSAFSLTGQRCVAIVLIALFSGAVIAAPQVELPEIVLPAPFEDDNILDKTHAVWSQRVTDLGVRLDRLFGGEEFLPDHSSYIRARTTALLREEDPELELRLKARLALPNTERRLSLVLESEDDSQFDRAAGTVPSAPPILRSPNTSGFTAGLRYLKELSDVVDLDADIGVRLRSGLPDPYVRTRIERSMFIGLWEVRPSEELYWHYHKGRGARTLLLAQRPLPGPRFFRSISEFDWVYRERRAYSAQDLIISHEFNPLHAVQAQIGARGESDPTRLVNWFVNIGWRRNIYKNWLFVELRPELFFEREQDFQAEPRLFLTLETYFGDTPWPKMEGQR